MTPLASARDLALGGLGYVPGSSKPQEQGREGISLGENSPLCAPFSTPTHQHRAGAMAFPEEKQTQDEKGEE